MPLKLRPAVEVDVPQMYKVQQKAFISDVWARVIYPNGLSEEAWKRSIEKMRKDFDNPDITFMVVEDTDLNEIISISKWLIYRHERPESEWNKPTERRIVGEGANQEAADLIVEAMHEARRRNLRGRPVCILWLLDTVPEHQRRGAGSMLLKWGLNLADETGLDCYLEATSAGYQLYQKNGFRDVDSIELDFARCGKNVTSRHVCMERLFNRESVTEG